MPEQNDDKGIGQTGSPKDFTQIKSDTQRDDDAHKRLDEHAERLDRIERNLGFKE